LITQACYLKFDNQVSLTL